MSQAPTDRTDLAFDGRIQLNGVEAPELEVIVQLDDQFVVLGHSSGELGRWDRTTVQVSPIGRGWFTLDVEDETVTFLPRRPGYFAASTVDLLPVEVVEKRWWQRRKQEKAVEAPALSRKERKRLEREQASRAAPPPEISADPDQSATTAFESAPDSEQRKPASPPIGQASPPVESIPAEREMEAPDTSIQPPTEPASPWDDVPATQPDEGRHKKRRESRPESAPRPDRVKKPPRQKTPKPPKAPKVPRSKAVELAGGSRTVAPAGPKQKGALSRGFAGFRHGVKGMAWRISDELRQTGIVPFDRLPAAPARSRPSDDHKHDFQEHRLPGGLTRNVCHSCGLVSIGERSDDD